VRAVGENESLGAPGFSREVYQTPMAIVPCALCGYDAPELPCPHCGGAPLEPSLAQPPGGLAAGLMAVPIGLRFLFSTGGLKRWLIPPFLLTTILLGVLLTVVLRWLGSLAESTIPDDLDWAERDWMEGLSEGWGWLRTLWIWVVLAAEWVAEFFLHFLASGPLSWLAGFFLVSLVVWYSFSIVYEAVAGPFLDEIQARLEARWFGSDPRSRLERPSEIPVARCVRNSSLAGLSGAAAALVVWLVPGLSAWWIPVALLGPFFLFGLADREYGGWLAWVARMEGGALWVGIQASIVTGIILVFALPLYFVPVLGYFLFAAVTGFATSVTLLDIATERRGWKLRQRLAFVRRHLLTVTAFGLVAGVLLAVPFLGPLLMVPSSSIGGLWLLCRLDKGFLREPG